MNKEIIPQLQKLGLNNKEAQVYLTLLQLGPSSVLNISKSCDVKRSTTYNILQSLGEKGLISLEMDGSKNYYRAEPPHALENLVKRQENILSQCLPELESLQKAHQNKNFIKTYQSREGVHRAYDYLIESLTPCSEYLVMGDIQAWHDSDPDYFQNWVTRRQKIIQHGRSIFNDSPKAQEFIQQQKNFETQVKIMPAKHEINAMKAITSRLVFVHKTGKPDVVIIIENPDIVGLYQEMFNAFWALL